MVHVPSKINPQILKSALLKQNENPDLDIFIGFDHKFKLDTSTLNKASILTICNSPDAEIWYGFSTYKFIYISSYLGEFTVKSVK
jgi:hypothetical protein